MSLAHRRQPLLQSADAIAGNEDLMTEILIRLLAKSLCRFKCVSKRWYSLISRPDFSLLRMPKSVYGFFLPARSRGDKKLLYNYIHLSGDRTWVSPFKSLSFVDDRFTILYSCNGLFLCSSNEIHNDKHYIYNPTTKQFANIPPPPRPRVFIEPPPLINLAFDLSRSPHYKIVLVRPCGALNFQIEIYSSESRTWRPSGDPFPAKDDQCFANGVFLNGTMHWISIESETSLCFDVDRECLGTMPMPPIQGDSKCRGIFYYGESRGHLYLICGNEYTTPRHPFYDLGLTCGKEYSIPPHSFDVLEMKSDYSDWFVKYRFDLDAFKTTVPVFKEYPFSFIVLHIVRGEEEEQSYLVLYIEGMVISYNFNDNIAKKICYLPFDSSMHCSLYVYLQQYCKLYGQRSPVHQYIETLFRI